MKLFILLFTLVMGLSGLAQDQGHPPPAKSEKEAASRPPEAKLDCPNGKVCPSTASDGELSGRKGALTPNTRFTIECTLTDGTSKIFSDVSDTDLASAHTKFGCREGTAKRSAQGEATK